MGFNMKPRSFPVYDLCLISIFTAIITVMAQLSIPMPYGVPMTLQTFAILLAGVVLGAKKGTIATLVYVLLGIIGVPVFAGFNGGIGIVLGYTGGFIMSFPIMALTAGVGASKNNKWWLWGGLVAGVIINYICGVVYFSFHTSNDLIVSFTTCVLLFIPTDAVKIIAVGLFGKKMKDILMKGKLLK